MALEWIDGFDTLGANGDNVRALLASNGYTFYENSPGLFPLISTLSSNTVDNVGFSLCIGVTHIGYTVGLTRNLATSTGIVFGFRVYITTTGFLALCQVGYNNGVNGGSHHFRIFADGAGGISITKATINGTVYSDPATAGDLLCNSGPNVLFENTWQYIEVKFNVAGDAVVKVDGAIVLPATTISNAQNLPSINLVSFCNDGAGGGVVYIDDLVIMNQIDATLGDSSFTNYQGDCVVRGVMPAADAGTNTFTQIGGGAGHFSAVDDIPPDDDTSYLTGATSALQEMFTLPTFAGDVIDVLAVSLNIRSRKDSAGYATYQAAIAHAGDQTLGLAKTVASGYQTQRTMFTKSPAGSVWSTAAAQAMSIGLKIP